MTCADVVRASGGDVRDHLAHQLNAELEAPGVVCLSASHVEGHANEKNLPRDEGHVHAQRQHGSHVESHDHGMPKPVAVGQQGTANVPRVFGEFLPHSVLLQPMAEDQQAAAGLSSSDASKATDADASPAWGPVPETQVVVVPGCAQNVPPMQGLDASPAVCDQHEVDKSVSLLDSLPQDGPLFMEICAGSATLSDVARRRGFAIMPVDCEPNEHLTKCKICSLDVTTPHAQNVLSYALRNCRVAFVHMAPPCGTCSKARGIPLPDGSPGPRVLRSAEHPWGLPWVGGVDRVKLDASNAVYRVLAECVNLCEQPSIP